MPPLSSRGVLLVGTLSLACLALFAALLFETSQPEPSALALDGPPAAPAASSGVARPIADDAPAGDVVFPDDPDPISSGVLTALEQAAEEPLEVELARLFDALQYGFGERSVQVEPTLRPYAFRVAGRLNVRTAAFRIRVSAADPALAEARVATLRNLFEAAGAAPGRLTFVARRGAPFVLVEPA